MEKRTIIALVLIFVVFLISNELIWKKQNQTKNQIEPKPQVSEPKTRSKDTVPDKEKKLEVVQPEATVNDSSIIMSSNVKERNDLTLGNKQMKLVFTNRGALVNSILLLDYYQSDKQTIVNLLPPERKLMKIELQNIGSVAYDLNNSLFEYQYMNNDNTISFQLNTKAGKIIKRYSLINEHQIEFNFYIENAANIRGYKIVWDNGIAETEKFIKRKDDDFRIFAEVNNEIDDFKLSKLKKEAQEKSGDIDWAVLRSKYFLMGIIPDDLIFSEKLSAYPISYTKGNKRLFSPAINLSVANKNQKIDDSYELYFGPLIMENLQKFNNGIEECVPMGPGFLQWISKLFLKVFKLLDNFIPNMGLAIIVFAIIIKTLLFPLTHKSFEASTKMKKIQPKMQAIKEKYKHDPRLMQKETSKLYKEEGVNPLGGCLPLLIQLPILISLYPILRYSITIRQESFFWLSDLSEPDPYLILPIAMALFMILQQKLMAPSSAEKEEMDEKQQAAMQSQKIMMYVMPVVLFFIFKSLSAGLVLYYTMFNVISIFQQILIKKKFKAAKS